MWGLKFYDAYNCLLTIGGEFQVQHSDIDIKYYKFAAGQDAWISQRVDGKWERIKGVDGQNFQQEIEKLLPQKENFGFNWDYANFLIALTFFAEGRAQ